MDQKQLKTAAISAGATVFILLAFVVGMKLAGGPAANTPVVENQAQTDARTSAEPSKIATTDPPSKTPADAQDAIVDRLITSEGHLQAALASLNKASGNNKGGYDIKGREDLAQAIADITHAIDYAKTHAEIAPLPAPEARLDITAQVQVSRNHPNAAPNLGRALDSLSAALEELHKTPGGNIGGFRDKVLADIQLAAADTAMGITIAGGGGRGPQPNVRTPGPNMNTPNMNLTGVLVPDSATIRLQALQAALSSAADNLKQASAAAKADFLDQTLADVAHASNTVAAALDYVKTHPEADALPPSISPDLPLFDPPNGYGVPSRQDVKAVYPTLASASNVLLGGIRQFAAGPTNAGPVIGELGGFRDRILQDVSIASCDLITGTMAKFSGKLTAPLLPAKPNLPGAKPGSIAGVIIAPDGHPLPNAAVLYETPNPDSTGNPLILATITNDKGEFVIHDLPPGSYMINVDAMARLNGGALERAVGSKSAVVKEGAQTSFDSPLQLHRNPSRGVGGAAGGG